MRKSESARYSEDGLTLIQYSAESPARSFTVPARVKTIGKGAFAGAKNLKEVAFEPGSQLERIEEDAFRESALERMELPAGVVEIGDRAFMESGNADGEWKSFTFAPGSRLERIGNQAFYCVMLGEVTLPASLRFIGNWAFRESYDTEISFEPGSRLEHIGEEAFRETRMRRFDIPETMEKLGILALYGVQLRSLHIPAHLRELGAVSTPGYFLEDVTFAENSQLEVIGPYAFQNGKMARVDLPASVRLIDESAFVGTNYLRSFHIPETGGPLTIGEEAFHSSALDNITLPERVTAVGPRAFRNTSMTIRVLHPERPQGWAENWNANLTREECPDPEDWRHIRGECADRQVIWGWTPDMDKEKKPSQQGVRFSEDGSVLLQFPAKGRRREYTLPAAVREIAPRAFYGAAKLIRLEIPADSKLEVIGERAFAGSGLWEITLPASLKRIERDAFWQPWDYDRDDEERREEGDNPKLVRLRRDPPLDTLVFAPGCDPEFIHPTAFAWYRIRSFRIPESVKLLERRGDMLLLGGDTLLCFPHTVERMTYPKPKVYTLPAEIRRIAPCAFHDADVTELRFAPGSRLEEIGDQAFCHTDLSCAWLPPTLRRIGHKAFYNYRFGYLLFKEGSGLESIAPDAFIMGYLRDLLMAQGSFNFDSYTAQGNFPPTSDWYLEDDVLYSGDRRVLLRYLPRRRASCFTVPAQVEEIGPGAFYLAEKLTELEFAPGSRLRVIGVQAFEDSRIHTVTIPASVERIERRAFGSDEDNPDSGIRELHFAPGSRLEFIAQEAFARCPIGNTIKIPDSVTTIEDWAFLDRGRFVKLGEGESITRTDKDNASQVVIGPGSRLKRVEGGAFLGRRVFFDGAEVPDGPGVRIGEQLRNLLGRSPEDW